MKHLDEYRAKEAVTTLARAIGEVTTKPWTIMEVCGGQTHAIVRYGLDELLPEGVTLLHGPGCPVCATSAEIVDRAHAIASERDVIFCSFGDMLRVPGTHGDLLSLKADGKDIRIVYSPLDAVLLAEKNPEKRVVFFAIGFETTAPANAIAALSAKRRGIANFSLLVSHVLVPPMLTSILQAPACRVQAFLGPGHVCAIMGTREYAPIAQRYRVPIAVAGFEPVDLLSGVLACIEQLEKNEARVEVPYARIVTREGNRAAQETIDEVFEVTDRQWRGIGWIPKSGLKLRYELRAHDAEKVFDVGEITARENPDCISGRILKGEKKPFDCPAFGTRCTPESPLGATMVSSEGACAAYHAHRGTKRALPMVDGTKEQHV